MATKRLQVVIEAKNNADKAFTSLNKKMSKASDKSKTLNDNMAKLAGTFGGLSALRLVKALGILFVLRSGIRFTQESIRLAGVQEQAESRLSTVLTNVTGATKAQIDSLKNLASELQKTTKFGDEQIISSQAMLGTFQLTVDQIKALTPRILDMGAAMEKSTGTGTDLESITIAVGKSMVAGIGSLSRYGVVISDAQKKAFKLADAQEKVNIVTTALDANFKGIAAESAKTFSGRMQQLTNVFGDFRENIGKASMVLLNDLVFALGVNLEAMNETEAQSNAMIISVNNLKIAWRSLGVGIGITALRVQKAGAIFNKFTTGLVSELLGDKGAMQSFQNQVDEIDLAILTLENTLVDTVTELDSMNEELKTGAFDWDKYLGKVRDGNEVLKELGDTTTEMSKEAKAQWKKLTAEADKYAQKLKDIERTVKEESIAFQKAQLNKSRTFQEQLADMVASHKKSWEDALTARSKLFEKLDKDDLEDDEKKRLQEQIDTLTATIQKEFKILQPFRGREDLAALAARTDVDRLIEGFRRGQATETVAQAETIEGLTASKNIVINFDFKGSTFTEEDFINRVKEALSKNLTTINLAQ